MLLATAPLIEIDSADAQEHGETEIQLKESENYRSEVKASVGEDFRVRCSLAQRRRTIKSGDQTRADWIHPVGAERCCLSL